MRKVYEDLNEATIRVYEAIGEVERITGDRHQLGLSIVEIHMMDKIYRERGLSIKRLAEVLNVTMATVTVQIQKLVNKGYVEKNRNQNDLRGVTLDLTREGIKIVKAHDLFHLKVVKAMTEDLTLEDIEKLTESLRKIDRKLSEYIEKEKR